VRLGAAERTVASAVLDGDVVRVELDDGTTVDRHALALRDGCVCADCRHPVSGQRLFESGRVLRDLQAIAVGVSPDGALVIEWSDGHRGSFGAGWFADGQPGLIRRWAASLRGSVPEHTWPDVTGNRPARAAWLRDAAELGFAVLHGVPTEPGLVAEVAGLFGAVRETNYGRVFDVSVTVGATNLADTALPLSPHTDNPYRDPTPTLQLLHCLVSGLDGGETVLVDGFDIVERMRRDVPDAFATLAREPICFAYRDEGAELCAESPIVTLGPQGDVAALHLNNRSKGIPTGEPARVAAWYDAYLALLELVESPGQQLVFRLEPGDVVLFDNLRILHGRTGFAGAGNRDALLSTLAVLERR